MLCPIQAFKSVENGQKSIAEDLGDPAITSKITSNRPRKNTRLHKIIALNIRQGGGNRAPKLLEWILGQAPDLIVFSEWRPNLVGQSIILHLQESGYTSQSISKDDTKANSVLVAGRKNFELTNVTPQNSKKGVLGLADLGALRICASYFPQKEEKVVFFDRCADLAKEHSNVPFLLVGDLNTGNNELDLEPGGDKFLCDDQFTSLETEVGLADLWRLQHGPDAREWTWRSSKNGFRIDHAFANDAFRTLYKKINCHYLHEPRETKITDHSALVIDLTSVNEG